MLSREENDLITRTGAGTPMGNVMRRYWVPACLSREITKLHEEHVRATLGELAARYAHEAPRGECVLVVAGGVAEATIDIEAEVRRLLAEGLSPKDVAARLLVVTGKPRRVLYQLALALKRELP